MAKNIAKILSTFTIHKFIYNTIVNNKYIKYGYGWGKPQIENLRGLSVINPKYIKFFYYTNEKMYLLVDI